MERGPESKEADEQVSETVFKQIFIQRTLQEVERFEEDFQKMSVGEGRDIAYSVVTGLKPGSSQCLSCCRDTRTEREVRMEEKEAMERVERVRVKDHLMQKVGKKRKKTV